MSGSRAIGGKKEGLKRITKSRMQTESFLFKDIVKDQRIHGLVF